VGAVVEIEGPAGAAPAFDRKRAVGVLCGVLSVFLFSSFTLASRLGLTSSLTLPDIAALRFGIGGMLLLPVLLFHGLAGVPWKKAVLLAVLGGLGFALAAYSGFALAPAAHGAVLLHGTLPLTTLAIMSLMARQPRTSMQKLGTAIITTGIILMGLDSWAGASGRQLLGDGFLLLASLLWSGYGVLSRRLGLPPAQGAAIVAVFSMCAYLPVYALLPGKALFHIPAHDLLLQAVVQGMLIGAVSIFVYTRAIASLGPATMALFTAAVPCVTTLAAIPLLSEYPSLSAILGVAAVTTGMIVSLRAGRTG
jgi:drug/metabolite transporter (DMT)-like permease